MKKLTLIVSLLFAGVSMANAAETIYENDFSNGLGDLTTYDVDGGKPSATAQKYGYSTDNGSWLPLDYLKNPVAGSNSTHSPIKRAEDWLVTPALTLTEGNVFSFDAVSYSYTNASKVGEMHIKLSTTGNAVEDFTVDLATKVTVNGDAMVSFGYDLSEYAGQTVYLAIVNNGLSKDILIVDNLFVGVPARGEIELEYNRFHEDFNKAQSVTVNFTAGFAEAITTLDATLTCGDFTSQFNLADAGIAAGGKYTFAFPEKLPIPTAGDPQNFEVSVLINGVETVTAQGEVLSQAYQPDKRVFYEYQTGTWCGWCTRGHYYMEYMQETYPESFVGVAVHNGDVMHNYDYVEYLGWGMSAPMGRVQRDDATVDCDPSDFPRYHSSYMNKPAFADLDIKAYWTDETQTQIELRTTATFALSANNFITRLEYIVIEDDVHKPGDSNYNQYNNYSGGTYGEMGGYEDKSNPILSDDMYYQDVVRQVITGEEMGLGIKNSLPTQLTKGEAYTHHQTLDVPANVFNVENCEFVVLLIDYQTGELLNSAKVKGVNAPDAVKEVTNEASARAYAYGDGVRVEVCANATVEVNVYSIDGQLVSNAVARKVNGNTAIDCAVNGNGIYLVNVVCDGVSQTYKVVL